MIHDVISAVYREGYKIEVSFDDGRKGVIDLRDIFGAEVFLSDSRIWITFEVLQ